MSHPTTDQATYTIYTLRATDEMIIMYVGATSKPLAGEP